MYRHVTASALDTVRRASDEILSLLNVDRLLTTSSLRTATDPAELALQRAEDACRGECASSPLAVAELARVLRERERLHRVVFAAVKAPDRLVTHQAWDMGVKGTTFTDTKAVVAELTSTLNHKRLFEAVADAQRAVDDVADMDAAFLLRRILRRVLLKFHHVEWALYSAVQEVCRTPQYYFTATSRSGPPAAAVLAPPRATDFQQLTAQHVHAVAVHHKDEDGDREFAPYARTILAWMQRGNLTGAELARWANRGKLTARLMHRARVPEGPADELQVLAQDGHWPPESAVAAVAMHAATTGQHVAEMVLCRFTVEHVLLDTPRRAVLHVKDNDGDGEKAALLLLFADRAVHTLYVKKLKLSVLRCVLPRLLEPVPTLRDELGRWGVAVERPYATLLDWRQEREQTLSKKAYTTACVELLEHLIRLVADLHRVGYGHGSLDPECFGMRNETEPVLVAFDTIRSTWEPVSVAGPVSPFYMAPEMAAATLAAEAAYVTRLRVFPTDALDLWSVGAIGVWLLSRGSTLLPALEGAAALRALARMRGDGAPGTRTVDCTGACVPAALTDEMCAASKHLLADLLSVEEAPRASPKKLLEKLE